MPRPTLAPAACIAICFCILSLTARGQPNAVTSEQKKDLQALYANVALVDSGTWSASLLALWGPRAVAVATTPNGSPMIAATRFGTKAGRVVVFGHDGMMSACCDGTGVKKLVLNAAGWAAGTKTSGIRIGVWGDGQSTIGWTLQHLFPARFPTYATVSPADVSIANVDVYLVDGQDELVGTSAANLRQFVSDGGGLLIAAQTWYWSYTRDFLLHPSNLLLIPMGIVITPQDVQFDYKPTAGVAPLQLGNADRALACLSATFAGNRSSRDFLKASGNIEAALRAVRDVAGLLPMTGPFWKALAQLEARASCSGINPDEPIMHYSLAGFAATLRTLRSLLLPPTQLQEAVDAKFFPGKPPAGTKPTAAPVVVSVDATSTTSYWQSLGLWAMAGTVVNVTLGPRLAPFTGITIRIGGWTDRLWDHEVWYRLPEASRQYTVTGGTTSVGSALGGLIYVILPTGLTLGKVSVTVAGAIKSPTYIHGTTTLAQWPSILAASPAPWGEIGSGKLIYSTPRSALAKVKKPVAVMNYWDKVMDAHAWLANISTVRANAMRIQHDADISNGYMHAGYPIMTFMDVVDSSLDIVQPVEQHWGQFHELGHNHQQSAWTWDCTGEVTVNWFSAHAEFAVRNNTSPANFYGWSSESVSRKSNRAAYFAKGADYGVLCQDAALFLDSYLLGADYGVLSKDNAIATSLESVLLVGWAAVGPELHALMESGGFGFELFKKTIAAYQTMAPEVLSQLDDDDDARLQMFVVTQSRVARFNFAPYYRTWGWPVSDATATLLASLPKWIKNPFLTSGVRRLLL